MPEVSGVISETSFIFFPESLSDLRAIYTAVTSSPVIPCPLFQLPLSLEITLQKATQVSFPRAFSHAFPCWPLLTRNCRAWLSPLVSVALSSAVSPPSLALSSPSASQHWWHHLSSLFTPSHSYLIQFQDV